MLKIAYDYDIASDGPDHLVELADMLVKTIFSEASQAGRWLVDIIPACMSLPLLRSPPSCISDTSLTVKYVPEWFPGAGFKKTARVWKTVANDFYETGFKFVKHQIVRVDHRSWQMQTNQNSVRS